MSAENPVIPVGGILRSGVALALSPTVRARKIPAKEQHCTTDALVYLDLPTGIHNFKGQIW